MQALETNYSRQSGGFSLASWALPLIISLLVGAGSISVAIYAVHQNNDQQTGTP
jgi:hypothetical protein